MNVTPKIYLKAFLGTIVLYLWALISTNIAFQRITLTILGCRIIYAVLSFLILVSVQRVLCHIENPVVRNAVIAFGVYEIVNLIILRLIYPGAWKWDDIVMFNWLMGSGHLNYWQHYLSIVFYIFCLCIFPFPAGIVLIQFSIISVIFGYFFYVLSVYLKGGKLKYIILAPFFFVPTFDFNQWPLRLSLY